MSGRRSLAIWTIGLAVVGLQFTHLIAMWLLLWPRSSADCSVSERWCGDWVFIYGVVGVLPQLVLLTITIPFAIWGLLDLVARARSTRRVPSSTGDA